MSSPCDPSPHLRGLRKDGPTVPTRRAIHPRTCGVYRLRPSTRCNCPDPSPHLRGLLSVDIRVTRGKRSIPAPAGSTSPTILAPRLVRIHPRTCGVYRAVPPQRTATLRSIPAPAGSTDPRTDGLVGDRIHPRTCGVYAASASAASRVSDPSPHLRGLPFLTSTVILAQPGSVQKASPPPPPTVRQETVSGPPALPQILSWFPGTN